MKITNITKENEKGFIPLMPETARTGSPDILRIGVLDADNIAGVLCAEGDSKVVNILGLYVLPEYRRRGYGSALLDVLLLQAEPSVYTAVSVQFAENDEAKSFFLDQGFEIFESMPEYYITFRDLKRSSKCRKMLKTAGTEKALTIASLNGEQRNIFARHMQKKNYPLSGFYDPDWSTVFIRDDKVTSLMLVRREEDSVIILWMDFSVGNVKEPFLHMSGLINRMNAAFVHDNKARVRFAAENDRFVHTIVSLAIGEEYLKKEKNYMLGILLLGDDE